MSVEFPAGLDRTCETLTGWDKFHATDTSLTLDSSNPAFGSNCLRCESLNSGQFQGPIATVAVPVSPNTQYTASAYVRSPNAHAFSFQIQERTAGGGFVVNQPLNLGFLPGDDVWRRYSVTFTTSSTTAQLGNWRVYNNAAQNTVWYVDGWQLDLGSTAQPYDGADNVPEPEFIVASVKQSGIFVSADMYAKISGEFVPVSGGENQTTTQLFSPTSPFNTEIPTSPDLLTTSKGFTSSDMVTQLLSHGSGKTDPIVVNPGGSWDYSHPVYYAQEGDPVVTVSLSENWDGGHVDGRTIRVPADAAPATGGDGHLGVVQLENDPEISSDCQGMVVGLYDVTNWTGAWEDEDVIEATSGGKSHISTGSGTDLGNVTAAGFNVAAGIPLAKELAAGEIPHALFIITNCSDSDAVAPAQPGTTAAVCGSARYPGLSTPIAMPPMGARLQLDPSYDISGFPAGQQTILRALQKYGGYVGDTGMYSRSVMFGTLLESPQSGGQQLEDFCNQAVLDGWATVDTNDGTPVWFLDFGKNVDWSNIRFVDEL